MQKNIDSKGRMARALSGIVFLGFGVIIMLGDWPANVTYRYTLAAFLGFSGLFQLFEAKQGWCVMRAFGIKTPL